MEPQVTMPMNRPSPQPMQPMPTQTPVQPAKMSPAPKKRKWLTMLIALVVLLAVAGGVYFWQQKKIDDLDKQVTILKVQNHDLSYNLMDLKNSTEDMVVFNGSLDNSVRDLGYRIADFYKLAFLQQRSNQPCDEQFCENYRSYLTDEAIQQLKSPRQYSLISCSQMGVAIYSISEPQISTNKATANISYLPPHQPLTNVKTYPISLVNSSGQWQISNFGCNP